MKKFPQLLGLIVASSALLFTACAKKPVRGPETAAPTGNNGINPDSVAVTPQATDVGNTSLAPRDGDLGDQVRNVVEPVYFEFDRSAVAAKERPKIDAAVKYLKDNPTKRMLLEGHCDWRGTAEYNLGLGDHRATAVRKYLEQLGIETSRLEILSKGSQDAKQGGTAADWAKDRRVEFVVLNK
ncbi:MAG TPA: OmpA family protein [Candidatus Didemnitutus sp.]|nr:OmpA family protein [Candidatus Didemnitutus sp.]